MCYTHSICQGKPIRDPFWHGLSSAVQWYDILQVRLDQQLEAAIVAADATVRHSKAAPPSAFPSLSSLSVDQPNADGDAPLTPCQMLTSCPNPSDGDLPVTPVPSPPLNECSRILQQRCPTCFSLNTFGRLLWYLLYIPYSLSYITLCLLFFFIFSTSVFKYGSSIPKLNS